MDADIQFVILFFIIIGILYKLIAMYLEGDKWKNWHTRCSDAAIKENKDEEDTKLSTISVSKLLEYAHTALRDCEINNLDPDKVPVFLTLGHVENLYSNIGLSICCSSQLGTYITLGSSDYYKMFYVAPDSKPEVGEYWRSRGIGYDLSGFVVSKLAGERLTRLVKYVLNTDEPLSHLDYREFEPNWIQFKFQKEEFNLELLDKLARANKNIVNETILRQCFKFRKEKFNLELLDNLTRENDGTINKNILRQCMINDSEKETDL